MNLHANFLIDFKQVNADFYPNIKTLDLAANEIKFETTEEFDYFLE